MVATLFVTHANAQGTHQGHEYVDLGLSVKWATCNVGANSAEEYGDHYAWGETSIKSSYSEANCATWEKSIDDIAGTDCDAARVNWGGNWRMPTKAEFDELISQCIWTWTTQNDISGYKVTSKINRNSIFLPAAGRTKSSITSANGSIGYYWCSSPYQDNTQLSSFVLFTATYHQASAYKRFEGISVRPVLE